MLPLQFQPGVTEKSGPPENPGTDPNLLDKTDPGSLVALHQSLNEDPLNAVHDSILPFG